MTSLLEQQFRNKWAVWAAVGAGCLAGVSGLFLVQRLAVRLEHTTSQSLSCELASLHSTIRELQEEIRQMKRPPLKPCLRAVTFSEVERSLDEKNKASQNLSTVSSCTSTTEYFSTISSDDDEEYFDLPNDDENGLKTPTNAPPDADELRLREAVDRLESELPEIRETRDFFREVDELMEGKFDRQSAAYDLLTARESEMNDNADFLWRVCKSTYLKAVAEGQGGDAGRKRSLIFEAVDYGRQAVDIDERSSEAHKWYAVVVGSRAEYLGIREKILDGFEFKKHIDRASELSPNDHTIRHLIGRFCYEVAALSWLERKMASSLFAEPPCATMEEARDHFLAAEMLKPVGWKENRLFCAKTNIQLSAFTEAVSWLDKADELPVNNPDDEQAQKEIEELLAQYSKYRS